MIKHEETERQRRFFNFNTQVPDSGNVPRDRAEIKVRFEKALDEFFERYASQQSAAHHELERV